MKASNFVTQINKEFLDLECTLSTLDSEYIFHYLTKNVEMLLTKISGTTQRLFIIQFAQRVWDRMFLVDSFKCKDRSETEVQLQNALELVESITEVSFDFTESIDVGDLMMSLIILAILKTTAEQDDNSLAKFAEVTMFFGESIFDFKSKLENGELSLLLSEIIVNLYSSRQSNTIHQDFDMKTINISCTPFDVERNKDGDETQISCMSNDGVYAVEANSASICTDTYVAGSALNLSDIYANVPRRCNDDSVGIDGVVGIRMSEGIDEDEARDLWPDTYTPPRSPEHAKSMLKK